MLDVADLLQTHQLVELGKRNHLVEHGDGGAVALQAFPQVDHGLGGNVGGGGGVDDEVVAEALELVVLEDRGTAALDHVGERQTGDLLVDEHHLFLGLGGLDEDNVRAGFLVSKATLDGLFDAVNGTGVGTGHDHHVALAGINGGLDLADHLFHGNDLTAGHVAALLGHDLVLELNDGDAGLLILADGALHVDGVAEAGVGVGDDEGVAGSFHGVGSAHDHFAHGHQADVGLAEVGGALAVAGHVHGVEAEVSNDLRGESVVAAGGDDELFLFKELAHFLSVGHGNQSP